MTDDTWQAVHAFARGDRAQEQVDLRLRALQFAHQVVRWETNPDTYEERIEYAAERFWLWLRTGEWPDVNDMPAEER